MNRIKKFISMLLATTILLTNFSSVFARSQITDGKELIKIDNNTIINTNFYGEEQLSDLAFAFKDELEYESDKSNQIQTRSIWDFVDVVMAGFSWKDFLKDPSLGNFGWAILDTASILPFLPSSAYFRKGGKTLLKMDEVAKFASKSSKNKKIIKNGIKKISPSKAKSLIRKIAKGYYLSNDVYRNHILVRHSFNSKVKGTSKFIKGFDIKNAIKKTLTDGTAVVSANSNNRYGYVFVKNFYTKIGTDHGKSLKKLKVIINNKGKVVTAFPVK